MTDYSLQAIDFIEPSLSERLTGNLMFSMGSSSANGQ
jgi:hypothetical protein